MIGIQEALDKAIEDYLQLEKENKELQQRILKAIQYIKEYYPTSTIYYQDEQDKLIKILTGGENG